MNSKNNSKFVQSDPGGKTVIVEFEGEQREVPADTTVAAALLGHDDNHFCRSAAEGSKRAPYCLMGVCFECMVEIDGIGHRQACLEPVYDGMTIKRQDAQVDERHEK